MKTKKSGDVALLWDESFLWGLMAYRALTEAGLPFRLVRAAGITEESLSPFSALFVPGGWASKKIIALGERGVEAVRDFVGKGGTFIGFCGGAGLATSEGLGLVDVKRKPTSTRVPSFSGRIRLTLLNDVPSDSTGRRPSGNDPLWLGIDDPVFHAWWPSQFKVTHDARVLARYGEALPDAFSSDLNVGDVVSAGGWEELEQYYGINLDPKRMLGEPAVLRARFGRGTVLLSLIHFDTPGDANGRTVLRNLWRECGVEDTEGHIEALRFQSPPCPHPATGARPSLIPLLVEMTQAVDGLIDLGIRNFLWFRRNPYIFQWRRGVRGLEYSTLKALTDEIAGIIGGSTPAPAGEMTDAQLERLADRVEKELHTARELLLPFVEEAAVLLTLERRALLRERLTFEESNDPRIRALRTRLFSTSKSHGGLFKQVIDRLDGALYALIEPFYSRSRPPAISPMPRSLSF